MAKKLTTAQVAKLLRAKGLKATPDEIRQLTRMMNDDLEREARAAAERTAALRARAGAADRLMAKVYGKAKGRR